MNFQSTIASRRATTSLVAFFFTFLTLAFCYDSPSFADDKANASGDLSTIFKFTEGFSNLMKSPKEKTTEKDAGVEENSSVTASAGVPIPKNAGVVLQVTSLKTLDRAVGELSEQTGGDRFSALTALRLTAYRNALSCINTNNPVAVVVFCDTVPPRIAVELPVSNKQFETFVSAVAKASKSDKPIVDSQKRTARFTLTLNNSLDVVARQVSNDYVVVTNAENESALAFFESSNVSSRIASAPEELKSPIVTINVSEQGLTQLTKPNRPFWVEMQNLLVELQKTNPALAKIDIEAVHRYVADNLAGLRYDLAIDDYGLYAALQTTVKPNSDAAAQLATYRDPYPLNVTADRFFSILPDVESTLAGQVDLPGSLSQTLPAPFNRVSFVEYCLGLPTTGELAAESFMFYLEVDDADAFAREMIVPRAREIGRYIGSKQASDAASQLFGSIAERRLARQNNSRRPIPDRRRADPERAAEVGGALGSLIGGIVGENAGEETAMKERRINGFKTYVSDIETYVRQTALMKAEKNGSLASSDAPKMRNGAFSPVEALISIIQNDGELQNGILRSANDEAAQVDQTPLFAREGYLVVLNKNAILFSLGNQDLLKLGINNYRATKEPGINYIAQTHDVDATFSLRRLGALIPNLKDSNIIGSMRVDPAAIQAYYRWLQKYYFPSAPKFTTAELPIGTPKLLVVSSVYPNRGVQRFVLPHKATANLIKTYGGGASLTELLLKPRNDSKNSENANSDDDFSVDFDDK